ncbi:unnamed protein product [Caenorhabditis auriculariae]|uniref:Uncharacterized protein n=1 Tax=Caenorhabditis auriculariae TaxID=2777116 RepID=A0A8S1GWE1_9PELO|nr:unnamed protein product [Caenorhabditis auriculariae]
MGGSTSKPKTPSNTSLSPSPPQMPLRAATDTTPDVSCTLRRAKSDKNATPLNSEFFANQPGIEMSDKHVVYDIPSQLLRLRNNKKRANRSKADPWRRFGAYNLLCEIGGTMIDSAAGNKNKTNKSYVNIKPGTVPPPAPQVKPLLTVEDYMTFKLEGNQARKSDSFNDC